MTPRKGLRASGSGDAAREHLAAGRPIVYWEPGIPENCMIREFPSGRKEVVDFGAKPPCVVSVLTDTD